MRTRIEQMLINYQKLIHELDDALQRPNLYMKLDERSFIRGHRAAIQQAIIELKQILEIDEDLSEIMF